MTHTTRWLGLLVIILIAITMRFWRIDSLPPGFYYAEAYEGMEAWRILTEPGYHPVFLLRNDGVPPLNAYANAVMFGLFRLFGGEVGPVAMRVTAACFGVLAVLALYGLAGELRQLDRAKASLSIAFPFFAAAVLAVMRWHIHFSRIGIEPILTPLIWATANWLLLRGWRTGEWSSFVGSGVMFAAAIYAYQAAWVIPLLALPVVLLLLFQPVENSEQKAAKDSLYALRARFSTRQGVGLIIATVVALLVFAPFGWFFWQHPDLVLLRSTQVRIANSSGAVTQDSVWGNLVKIADIYNPLGNTGDRDARRNLPDAPALNGWLASAFFAGLGLAMLRVRRPSYAILLLSLVGLLLPGVFTTDAPNFHRLLGATAPTALLCAIGLDRLWQWRPPYATQVAWLSLLVLGLGGITSAQEYFIRWASLPDLTHKFDAELWAIAQQVTAQPPNTPLYLTPSAISHPTLMFALQTHNRPTPIVFDGRTIFPLTAQVSSRPELYMVLEDDFRTPLLLPEIFPTARLLHEARDHDATIANRLYLRPPNAIPQRPPQHPLLVTLGDGIVLQGYDIQPAALRAGQVLYLQLHWVAQAMPTGDWTVFTHLLTNDATGKKRLVAGYDSPPGAGSLRTTRWQAGWRILDEYQIPLPAALTAGEYGLEIGLYQTSGKRLPATGTGVSLGKVKIER